MQPREKPVELVFRSTHEHGVKICDLWMREVESRAGGGVHFTKITGEAPESGETADVVHDTPAKGGQYHLLDLIQIPYIIPGAVVGSQVISQLYAEFSELRDELGDNKMVGLGTGSLMAIFSSKKWGPIRTTEDFKGAKIRSLLPIDKAIEALGGRPVHVRFLDIPQLMEHGDLDATILGLLPAMVGRLPERGAPYCTLMEGRSITMHPMRTYFKWEAWNRLPADIQKAIESIGPSGGDCWFAVQTGQDADAHVKGALEYLTRTGEIITLSSPEQQKWLNLMQPALDSAVNAAEGSGLPARRYFKRMMDLAEKYSRQSLINNN